MSLTGKPITLSAHQRPVTCVKLNRDGDLLFTASSDKRVMLWYLSNGERIGTYDGHNGAVYDCDVDASSKLMISASADSSIKLWEVETGKCLTTFSSDGDFAPRRNCEWAADGQRFLYTTARYKEVPCRIVIQRIGDTPGAPPEPDLVIPCSKELIADCKWGPKCQTIITVQNDGTVSRYDAATGRKLQTVIHTTDENKEITCLEFSKDRSQFLVCSRDKRIKLYNSSTLATVAEYQASKPLNSVSLHPTLPIIMACGGEKAIDVALTGADKGQFEVQFYHLILKAMIGEVNTGHYSPVNVCAFYPGGEGFVTGADEGNARLFRLSDSFSDKFSAVFG